MAFDFKVNAVAQLFETPDRPADFKSIRREIPRREDPLLTGIMDRERKIVAASRKDPSDLESTLKGESFQVEKKIQPRGKKRKAEIPLWKDKPDGKRICMDNATWKVNASFIKTLKDPSTDNHKWTSYTTNVKTCTSVLTNEDATFCGSGNGALVYLAPTSPNSLISASPCDVVSPSETHKGNIPFFQSARSTTQSYCADQFKYNVAFDMVRNVKGQSIQVLSHLIDLNADATDQNVTEALSFLNQKGASIFDRKFYSFGSQETNLEIEIDHIISAIDAYPELEKLINHSRQEFVELKQKVHDYLQHPDIVNRGVQRNSTTGWELSNAADENHPLLPKMRSSHHKIQGFESKLAKVGIAIPELTTFPGAEDLDPVKAKEFIDKNKEQFYQQIYGNTVAGYTVTEAVTEMKTHQKRKLQHLEQIEEKAKGVLSTSGDVHVKKKARKLQEAVVETKTPFTKLYPEIQFRSKKLEVAGFGIKKNLLDQLETPKFDGVYNDYHAKKEARAQAQAKLLLAEQELLSLTGAGPITPKSSAVTLKEDEITDLKKQIEDLDKEIAALQSDPALATYRLISTSTKHNLPCFVHYGQ
ncbi:MAG: hypothetical protein JSR39_00015 [Verrucomicrobia bacterium]|nr:hypothetical protein [Verrucomicrobiota bacterium]